MDEPLSRRRFLTRALLSLFSHRALPPAFASAGAIALGRTVIPLQIPMNSLGLHCAIEVGSLLRNAPPTSRLAALRWGHPRIRKKGAIEIRHIVETCLVANLGDGKVRL